MRNMRHVVLLVLVLGCAAGPGPNEGDGPRRVTPLTDGGAVLETAAPGQDAGSPPADGPPAPPADGPPAAVPDAQSARDVLDPAALSECRSAELVCGRGRIDIVRTDAGVQACRGWAIGRRACRICDWVCVVEGNRPTTLAQVPCKEDRSLPPGCDGYICVRSCEECQPLPGGGTVGSEFCFP